MIRIKFFLIFFMLSTRLLFSQNNIDSISKIIPFLENKIWQIQSVETIGQLPEFGLDTTIVYSFEEFTIEQEVIKGGFAVLRKDIRNGSIMLDILHFIPPYDFSLKCENRKIIMDYVDEEFLDEIIEINERIFKIKRIYKQGKYNDIIIVLKKL